MCLCHCVYVVWIYVLCELAIGADFSGFTLYSFASDYSLARTMYASTHIECNWVDGLFVRIIFPICSLFMCATIVFLDSSLSYVSRSTIQSALTLHPSSTNTNKKYNEMPNLISKHTKYACIRQSCTWKCVHTMHKRKKYQRSLLLLWLFCSLKQNEKAFHFFCFFADILRFCNILFDKLSRSVFCFMHSDLNIHTEKINYANTIIQSVTSGKWRNIRISSCIIISEHVIKCLLGAAFIFFLRILCSPLSSVGISKIDKLRQESVSVLLWSRKKWKKQASIWKVISRKQPTFRATHATQMHAADIDSIYLFWNWSDFTVNLYLYIWYMLCLSRHERRKILLIFCMDNVGFFPFFSPLFALTIFAASSSSTQISPVHRAWGTEREEKWTRARESVPKLFHQYWFIWMKFILARVCLRKRVKK